MTGIQKISSIILWIIGGLSVIFAGFYFLGGSVPETIGTQFEEKNFTTLVLAWAVILFLIAGLATLIFSFINVFENRKAVKGFLVVLVIGLVLFGISYLLASSAAISNDVLNIEEPPTAATLKWVGTGLNATYILALVAFVGILASEVIRAIK